MPAEDSIMGETHMKTAPRTLREWLKSLGETPEAIERDLAVCRKCPETRALLIQWAQADGARTRSARTEEEGP